MKSNLEFKKEISTVARPQYCLCDLHVHSPASHDYKHINKNGKRCTTQELVTSTVPAEIEEKAQIRFPIETYYDQLIKHFNTTLKNDLIPTHSPAGIVAITDHNICEYAAKLSNHAWANLKENKLVVLPGIELEVEFPLEQSNDETCSIHMLIIFPPNTPAREITHPIYSTNRNWEYGQPIFVDSLPKFVNAVRDSKHSPAVIAAHITGKKGLHEETKNASQKYFEEKDSEFARISGALTTPNLNETEKKNLNDELGKIQNSIQNDSLRATLALIGECGFDAIQLSSLTHSKHYQNIHRYEKKSGRAVPIIASDAHDITSIFCNDDEFPFLKLSKLPYHTSPTEFFNSLKNLSLRLGETRFRTQLPSTPSAWLAGITIEPDSPNTSSFWNNAENMPLALSQNLNCLIGGRGSGKSALIDAISCIQDIEKLKKSSIKKEKVIPDWIDRTLATLGGCTVKLWWQHAQQQENLRKGALFQELYIPNDGIADSGAVKFSDIDGKELTAKNYPLCTASILRVKDIETSSNPEKLTRLFDKLCGQELIELTKKIAQKISTLETQRHRMVTVGNTINEIRDNNPQLDAYVKNKKAFDKINTPEMEKLFKKSDEAILDHGHIQKIKDKWLKIDSILSSPNISTSLTDFLHELEKLPKQSQTPCFENLKDNLLAPDNTSGQLIKTFKQQLEQLNSTAQQIYNCVKTSYYLADSSITETANSLSEQGIPRGGHTREKNKKEFDASKRYLTEYREALSEFTKEFDIRKHTCEELQELLKKRSELREDYAQKFSEKLATSLDQELLEIKIEITKNSERTDWKKWLFEELPKGLNTNYEPRINILTENLLPTELSSILLHHTATDEGIKKITQDKATQAQGKITADEATNIIHQLQAIKIFRFEDLSSDDLQDNYPSEIKTGLKQFTPQLDAVLKLDELYLEDLPAILLNDRPSVSGSTLRNVKSLSLGQRCSAVLPILLLSGTEPLIIDQPEDNLDNRLIRQVVVNILNSIKLTRQVILATHNPNIPVIGDSEQAIVLQAINDKDSQIISKGDLEEKEVVRHITEVMEGGREAFQYRQTIYQTHWDGSIDTF